MALPRIQPIERATKRTWDEWMAYLDGLNARDLPHADIAARAFDLIDGEVENAGWWAQSVAVTYEQAIGRRIPGQRSDGTFEMSVSKATPVGMHDLMEQWTAFAGSDQAVVDLITGEPRVSGTDKRITWRTKARDGSSIIVTSEPKRDGRASIVVQHTGLATLEDNDAARELWRDILARFVEQAIRQGATGR
jgi:hypothetical protein